MAPKVSDSTKEERRVFIQEKYHCINDCDMCGLCVFFHHKDPELVFEDYIEGVSEFDAVLAKVRNLSPEAPGIPPNPQCRAREKRAILFIAAPAANH